MQRVESTVDKHHPVFARHSVRPARIEILDGEHLFARQVRNPLCQCNAVLHVAEMPTSMKAGYTQQQREAQPIGRQDRRARHCHGPRCNHAGHLGKASGIFGTACCPHQLRRIDHRSRTAREHVIGACQRYCTKIGITNCVDHKGMRRKRLSWIVKVGVDRGDVEMMVIDPVLRRDVAAARRN